MDVRYQQYQPGASRYNPRITDEEWDRHKEDLRQLHERKLTRAQILEIITPEFGDVKPTYGQLCTRFEKWGFLVYSKAGKPKRENNDIKKQLIKDSSVTDFDDLSSRNAFSPESSNGSTIVPDISNINLNDKPTPTSLADIPETPENRYVTPAWNGTSPRTDFHRFTSGHSSAAAGRSSYEADHNRHDGDQYIQRPSYEHPTHLQASFQPSTPRSKARTSFGDRASISETLSMTSSRPSNNTTTNLASMDQDEPETLPARTRNADGALDAVMRYLQSLGPNAIHGNPINAMLSLAAYLFATRSYSTAFRLYRRIYDFMVQDLDCDDVSRVGGLMKCCQSAMEPSDLDFMQKELHQVLKWELSDSSLSAFVSRLLLSIEAQISEGLNLSQVSGVVTTPIMKNTSHLMGKGCESSYSGTRRIYWRLKLLSHTPFHSGCARLLKLLSELLSWAWAAMAVLPFPDPTIKSVGCLCKDGLYFDFVRMITTVILQAAVGFDILDLIKIRAIRQIPCTCIMCVDIETTFDICPIETFTAIAFLTVDRCRLDWTSCTPGGRHQELLPRVILKEQLLPTIESLLDQVAANIQSPTNIHTSDLYDDFLSCIWSCFETHDLPLKKARFDASFEKIDSLIAKLLGTQLGALNSAARPRTSTDGGMNDSQPVFDYGQPGSADIASKITAVKRNRSNASSLKPTASNASERSMIRIRKKLKFRSSQDILNSMSSYSSLSSRNSMRFSYVTGLPDLEPVLDQDEQQDMPPDMRPEEFAKYQRPDTWHSRPESTMSVTIGYRDSVRY